MNTEKMLLNMALKSMKDNFLSLDDEKKQKEFNRLLDENQELKAKIKTYEDPEDLTLMFMYCDEKVKDKIKGLNKQLEENEEEIKKYQKDRDTNTKRYLEVKDYIKSRIKYCKEMTGFDCCIEELEEVLQRI